MFRKLTGKGTSIPLGIGLGILLSLVITLLGAVVVAFLLVSEKIGVSAIGWAAMLLLGLGALGGSSLGAGLAKVSRLPVCMAVGGGYFLVLLMITALFFGGQYQGITAMLISAMTGSLVAGFLGLKGNKGFNFKKKKVAYR